MKSNSIVSLKSSHLNIEHIVSAIPSAFSEDEILAINELLLSKGFHKIQVSSLSVGRNIICMFLKLLHHYHAVYWLAENGLPVELDAFDMKELLYEHHFYIDQLRNEDSEYIFTEMPHNIDCLIIECDIERLQQLWYIEFQSALHSSAVLTNIPIIQITC